MANFIANLLTIEYAGLTTLSAGVTLPVATIPVNDTFTFPTAGTFMLGTQTVTYTGKTATTFTGATGGTGTFSVGARVQGSTFVGIQGFANDFSISQSIGEADTTVYGTLDTTAISGLRSASAGFKLMHDDGPYAATHQSILAALQSYMLYWRVRVRGIGVGKPEYLFDAFFTSNGERAANDNSAVASDFGMRVNGVVSRVAQV